jgi:cob(I)alamin adenosyltransferase
MKIYTKTGDSGQTSLAQGGRVSKSDERVELYGTCDELMSSIGLVQTEFGKIQEEISIIQNILFELGSELAGFRKQDNEPIILEEDIVLLEKSIDEMQLVLPPLKTFILPGGCLEARFLHLARTICRRLERLLVRYQESGGEVLPNSLVFINRLSDYLFVAARLCNFQSGIEDVKWYSRAKGKVKQTP